MDNIDKLIEAVENPENFSEHELHTLLSDPEARHLYRMLCASRSETYKKSADMSDAEIEKEWNKFNSRRHRNPFTTWLLSRKVAVVAALLIASCSIIVVGISWNHHFVNKTEAPEQQIALPDSTPDVTASAQPATPNDTIIIFEDEKLDKILTDVAPYYNAKVNLRNVNTKELRLFLRWDSTTSIDDLIEHLNSFDRINLFLKDDTITDY